VVVIGGVWVKDSGIGGPGKKDLSSIGDGLVGGSTGLVVVLALSANVSGSLVVESASGIVIARRKVQIHGLLSMVYFMKGNWF